MIKISLDECGDFENIKGEREETPVFIGGVIYDDYGHDDEKYIEQRRISAYYKSVCRDVGGECSYPQDLHCDGNVSRNRKVGKVKERVNETLGEFLQKGTLLAAGEISHPQTNQNDQLGTG